MLAHELLFQQLKAFARTAPTVDALMEHICERLHSELTNYNWVGFCRVHGDEPGILHVGPFVGSFTPMLRIPFDTGVCGAAARAGRTIVVHDVANDPNYLNSSSMVRCEIVVPIFVRGAMVAELDVESYFAGTFKRQEPEFVEAVAELVADYISTH